MSETLVARPDTPTDADRILAAGIPVRLAGGESARLRFDFRSYKVFEDNFGSLKEAAAVLTEMNRAIFGEVDTPILGHLAVFLAAGLGKDPVTVLDLLDAPNNLRMNLVELGTAVVQAWSEAFPAVKSAEGNGKGEPASGSPGETSSDSSPAPADEPTASSGL